MKGKFSRQFAAPEAAPPSPVRGREIDWLGLTEAERGAVRAYEGGDLPLEALSEAARTFVRRHRAE